MPMLQAGLDGYALRRMQIEIGVHLIEYGLRWVENEPQTLPAPKFAGLNDI